MGAWAVETLVHLLRGETEYRLLADKPTLLECPLVIRESVAEPRAN
jgi:LacI family transcriptional regulator